MTTAFYHFAQLKLWQFQVDVIYVYIVNLLLIVLPVFSWQLMYRHNTWNDVWCPTKGGKLCYAIKFNIIWANQKTGSFLYHWLRALATSFPAIFRASDVILNVLSIRQLLPCLVVCDSSPFVFSECFAEKASMRDIVVNLIQHSYSHVHRFFH